MRYRGRKGVNVLLYIYIGGRSMTYDVKFMYEMDMYFNNIYLDFKFLYLF